MSGLPGGWVPPWVKGVAGIPAGLLGADIWWAVPLALLQAITTAVRERLIDRPIELLVGEHVVRLTLRQLVVVPQRFGLAIGQLGDVHLLVEDVCWRGKRVERMSMQLHNVALRPGLRLNLVASPVEIEAVVASDDLGEWLPGQLTGVRVAIGPDASVRVAPTRFTRFAHLQLGHRIVDGSLWLIPNSLVVLSRRISARRISARRVALPTLPAGLHLVDVTTGRGELRVRLLAERWRYELTPGLLPELLRRVRTAQARLEVPVPQAHRTDTAE